MYQLHYTKFVLVEIEGLRRTKGGKDVETTFSFIWLNDGKCIGSNFEGLMWFPGGPNIM